MTTVNNKIPLEEFILLGQRLYLLSNPHNAQLVIDEIPKFIHSLEVCGLKRTLTAAKSMESINSILYHQLKRFD